MLISSLLPLPPVLGIPLARFERLMWFVYGHMEREHRLNQRALMAWFQRPNAHTSFANASPSLWAGRAEPAWSPDCDRDSGPRSQAD